MQKEPQQQKMQERKIAASGVLSPIVNAYYWVEDTFYYPMMDFLARLGLPVYPWFIDPIEDRGLPSFPFALFGILVILALLLLFFSQPPVGTATISLLSYSGVPVEHARVLLHMESASGSLVGFAVSGADGTVALAGVPLGRQLWVDVVAQGFENYSNAILPLSADGESQTIYLTALGSGNSKAVAISVKVVDTDSAAIAGASISASKQDGSSYGQFITSAAGVAKLAVPTNESVYLDVSKDGFVPLSRRRISSQDAPSATITMYRGSIEFASAVSVVVSVTNATGAKIPSQIVLSSQSGVVLENENASTGELSLSIPSGTRFLCRVVAIGSNAGNYSPYYSDLLIADDDVNYVDVVLSAVSSSNSSRIYIAVKNSKNKSYLDAATTLYEEGTNYFVARKQTKGSEIYFDGLNPKKKYYATAYTPGYYPAVGRNLSLGSKNTLLLDAIADPGSDITVVPDNSSIRATVLDADRKTIVPKAAVLITAPDGSFSGYPAVMTSSDGIAFIPGVRPEAVFRAIAEKPPRTGKSDSFTTSRSKTSNVTIYLDPATAFIIVRPYDRQTLLQLNATAVAKSANNIQLASCSTVTTGEPTCTLEVLADVPIAVNATATGYHSASASFTVPLNSRVYYNASLLSVFAVTATPVPTPTTTGVPTATPTPTTTSIPSTTPTPNPLLCITNGNSCTTNSSCCNKNCVNGICAPAPTPTPLLCITNGNSCTTNSSCCNKNCVNGICASGQCNKELPLGHNGCPLEKPVCGGDFNCRGCNSSFECSEELPYCIKPNPTTLGVCGCDATRKINGCPLELPYCTSEHKCVECTPENVRTVCGYGSTCENGKCKIGCIVDADCGEGLVCRDNKCGLGCKSDAECGSGLVCDRVEKVCYAQPVRMLVEYRIPRLNVADTPNAEVFYYANKSIKAFSLNISAIVPVSGFVLRLVNFDGQVRTVTFEINPIFGLYYTNSSKVRSQVAVPADKYVDLIVSYPDMDPAGFDSSRWGAGAGYWKAQDGSIYFNVSRTQLVILSGSWVSHNLSVIPHVTELGKYAASAGVIESKRNALLPIEPKTGAVFDPLYASAPFGSTYSLLLANNILLSNASYRLSAGLASADFSKTLTKSGLPLAAVSITSPSPSTSIWTSPVYHNPYAFSGIIKTNVSALSVVPNATYNHLELSTRINLAAFGLACLNFTLKNESITNAGKDVDLFGILNVGTGTAFKADGSSGRLSDVFLFAREGSAQRLLWFEYNPKRMIFKYPRDATATLEYADLNGPVSGTTSPYQKYLLAYPGQKDNQAYYCPTTSTCATPGSSLYVRGNKGNFYVSDPSAYGPMFTLQAATCQATDTCSGPKYCNPATKLLEEDAQQCCDSKVSRNGNCIDSGSNDACVLVQSGVWYYSLSSTSRVTSASSCGSNADCKNCFGHGCDASSCEASDYNGGDEKKGFDPYALLNPGKRCFTNNFVTNPCIDGCDCSCPPIVQSSCTACGNGCSYEYAVSIFPQCLVVPNCNTLRYMCVGNPPVEDFFPVCASQSSCSVGITPSATPVPTPDPNAKYGFGGVYEKNYHDGSCKYPNPFTAGSCSCPAGFSPGKINDFLNPSCVGGLYDDPDDVTENCGVEQYQCTSTTSTAYGFGGTYEVRLSDKFCRYKNPFTNECSCPSGFTASMFDAFINPECVNGFYNDDILTSDCGMERYQCTSTSAASYGFGGIYELNYTDNSCRYENPFTNACSCPTGFSSKKINEFHSFCEYGFYKNTKGFSSTCGVDQYLCYK